jgi:hypothetical protein
MKLILFEKYPQLRRAQVRLSGASDPALARDKLDGQVAAHSSAIIQSLFYLPVEMRKIAVYSFVSLSADQALRFL